MKPRFKIGDTVKVKATGKRVKIVSISLFNNGQDMFKVSGDEYFMYPFYESELKAFCPTRTGKYRNSKGQFVSKGILTTKDLLKAMNDCFNVGTNLPDSKQRNYQKILTKLDEIEKKIDELGRRV